MLEERRLRCHKLQFILGRQGPASKTLHALNLHHHEQHERADPSNEAGRWVTSVYEWSFTMKNSGSPHASLSLEARVLGYGMLAWLAFSVMFN